MTTVGGVPVADIVAALRVSVTEAKVKVRELESERDVLRETWHRKDHEIRTSIQEIEAQNKVARDALKALSPPKSKQDMRIEVESAIYEILLSGKEYSVSTLLEGLGDLSWEYEGRGFENRVRSALHDMEDRQLVKFRDYETQSKHVAKLWSIKNKKRKYFFLEAE